jgi:hypothetical protein
MDEEIREQQVRHAFEISSPDSKAHLLKTPNNSGIYYIENMNNNHNYII